MIVKPCWFSDPDFLTASDTRFHNSVLLRLLHAWKSSGRLFSRVGDHMCTEALVRLSNHIIQLVVNVGADLKYLSPLEVIRTPMARELVTMIR
jgi:hypothetical protein